MNRPFPSLLDRSFKYTPSGKTDIRKTFARIKKEMQEKHEQQRDVVRHELRRIA